jgi:hypothetical protein
MTMIIVILILAFIFAGIVLYEMPKKEPKEPKRLKYTIPPSFWDDYNHCIHSINKMKENETVRVENLIDNLMYQYVELLDSQTYIEKLSYLVELYNKKITSFLLTKHLN